MRQLCTIFPALAVGLLIQVGWTAPALGSCGDWLQHRGTPADWARNERPGSLGGHAAAGIAHATPAWGDLLADGDLDEHWPQGIADSAGEPQPCRGPYCSNAPGAPQAPPPAAPQVVTQRDYALIGADYRPETGRWSRSLPPDSEPKPLSIRDRVFRPPQGC